MNDIQSILILMLLLVLPLRKILLNKYHNNKSILIMTYNNLVPLQGWYAEKVELLLVYEFMANGSLDKVLHPEPENGILLTLSHRQNVAIGAYLHQEREQQIIHLDIKTSNIMLDGNFIPRLGDFGLARLMDHNTSPVSTLTAGTMGYLAPAYLQYGIATEKTDVFSYGVVTLEVACSRRPVEREVNSQKTVNLVDWFGEGRIIEAFNKSLNGDFEVEEMRKLLLVSLSCAHPVSAQRCSIWKILQILNNEVDPMALSKINPTLFLL